MDLVRQVRADREIASAIERDGWMALRNTTSFSAFPMLVPSLSWQNEYFSIKKCFPYACPEPVLAK